MSVKDRLKPLGVLLVLFLRICPLRIKFRKIPGGYQRRNWYRRAILAASAYEAYRSGAS